MGRDEALQMVVSMAADGRVAYTDHALLDKMQPFGLTHEDVVHVLTQPIGFEMSRDHHASDWIVTGVDLAGNALRVCVVIEADVLVITVF